MLYHHFRGIPALVLQLKLGFGAKGGADQAGFAFLGQLVGDQVAFGAVVQGDVQVKLFGNAQRCKDIVRPVCMGFQRDLLAHDRQHSVQLAVISGLFVVLRVLLVGVHFLPVVFRLDQQFAQQSGSAHTGHGHLLLAGAVAAFGVFAKSDLHGHRVFDDHIVHPLAAQLDGQEGAAHHIGAARAGDRCGHAVAIRVKQGFIHGVQAIDAPHLGCHGISHFVIVIAFKANGLFIQTDVAVCFHKAGGHQAALGVDHLGVGGSVHFFADCDDLAAVDQHLAVFNIRAGHGFYRSVFDQNHGNFPPNQICSLCNRLPFSVPIVKEKAGVPPAKNIACSLCNLPTSVPLDP